MASHKVKGYVPNDKLFKNMLSESTFGSGLLKSQRINNWTKGETFPDTNCSVLLLWHKDFMFLVKVPCDEALSDKAAAYCVNQNHTTQEINSVALKEHFIWQKLRRVVSINNVFVCDDYSMVASLRLCDNQTDCTAGENEFICSQSIAGKTIRNILNPKWTFLLKKDTEVETLTKLNTSFAALLGGDTSDSFSCFSENIQCLYDINNKAQNRSLKHCVNGLYLESCEKDPCNNMYKCTDYYCLPWRYVCDGY